MMLVRSFGRSCRVLFWGFFLVKVRKNCNIKVFSLLFVFFTKPCENTGNSNKNAASCVYFCTYFPYCPILFRLK